MHVFAGIEEATGGNGDIGNRMSIEGKFEFQFNCRGPSITSWKHFVFLGIKMKFLIAIDQTFWLKTVEKENDCLDDETQNRK